MRADNINMISEEAGVKHAKHENNLWTAAQQGCTGAFQKQAFLTHSLPLAALGRPVGTVKERKAIPTLRGSSLAWAYLSHRFLWWSVTQLSTRDSTIPWNNYRSIPRMNALKDKPSSSPSPRYSHCRADSGQGTGMQTKVCIMLCSAESDSFTGTSPQSYTVGTLQEK